MAAVGATCPFDRPHANDRLRALSRRYSGRRRALKIAPSDPTRALDSSRVRGSNKAGCEAERKARSRRRFFKKFLQNFRKNSGRSRNARETVFRVVRDRLAGGSLIPAISPGGSKAYVQKFGGRFVHYFWSIVSAAVEPLREAGSL